MWAVREGLGGGSSARPALRGALTSEMGVGGQPTALRDPAEAPSGMGAACQGHPAGRARPDWAGTTRLQAQHPHCTWAWVGGKGAALGGGVSTHGCGPLSLPRSPLMLPTKVVLTAALEWGSLPPPTPVTRQPEAQPCSHRSLQVTPCSSFPLEPG